MGIIIRSLAKKINEWAKDYYEYEYFNNLDACWNNSEVEYIQWIEKMLYTRDMRFLEVAKQEMYNDEDLLDEINRMYFPCMKGVLV